MYRSPPLTHQKIKSKLWEQTEHNRKTEWINNIKKKELLGPEEGPELDMQLKSHTVTQKSIELEKAKPW